MSNPELDKLIKPEKMHGGLKFFLWVAGLTLTVVIAWLAIDLTGLKAWQKHVVAMRSQGIDLEGGVYSTAPVPDEDNNFKEPTLESIAIKAIPLTSAATRLLSPPSPFDPAMPPPLASLLSWDPQGEGMPEAGKLEIENRPKTPGHFILAHYASESNTLARIYAACDRPRSRVDLQYGDWENGGIPDFVQLRKLAQAFSLRARANLAVGDTKAALEDLNVIRRLALMSEGRPTTIVQAMIEVAIAGLMTTVIEEGIQEGALSVQACLELQEQLEFFDLPASYAFSIKKGEIPGVTGQVMNAPDQIMGSFASGPMAYLPKGVFQRNLIVYSETLNDMLSGIDLEKGVVDPSVIDQHDATLQTTFESFSIATFLAKIMIPNLTKATQTAARNQMRIRMARIACALEAFRLEHEVFPEQLEDLSPRFIDPLPADIITGQPPVYHLTGPSEYRLYSVGWNQADDGGEAENDIDWVWLGGQPRTEKE